MADAGLRVMRLPLDRLQKVLDLPPQGAAAPHPDGVGGASMGVGAAPSSAAIAPVRTENVGQDFARVHECALLAKLPAAPTARAHCSSSAGFVPCFVLSV